MKYLVDYLIEIVLTVTTTLIIAIYKRIKKIISTIEVYRVSIVAIIKNIYVDKYYLHKNKGCISLNEKETLNNLYIEYKKLGGDGIIDDIRDEIDKIPIKKDC